MVNIDSHIDMNSFGFIYLINNKINNKKYIGQSIKRIRNRLNEHVRDRNFNKNHPLYNAANKYGWDNFEFSVIDTAQTLDELNNKEIKYIHQYQTTDKNLGYNIESGGKNAIPDIETLNKMSKSHLGRKQTDEWVDKRIAKTGTNEAKKYGRPKTNKEKELLSKNSPKYWLGKNRDDETKRKISETKKKAGLSEKQKENICKKVYKINKITNQIIEYNSTTHAGDCEDVNQSTISRWCKNEKIVNGFLWKY